VVKPSVLLKKHVVEKEVMQSRLSSALEIRSGLKSKVQWATKVMYKAFSNTLTSKCCLVQYQYENWMRTLALLAQGTPSRIGKWLLRTQNLT